MDHNHCDKKSNSIKNLKMMPQEELESRIDFLLAKCRVEVEIKKTAERGAMFSNGPFQISISLAFKMRKYQDDLLYCKRNPYDVLKSVCVDNGWDPPEFRAVDYMPGEGFLFSVIVNDHELVSKWRNRRPLLAADLASANFLRYLGLWVNIKSLDMYFDWEQINTKRTENQMKAVGDLNGYLYFMGFNLVKTETIGDEQNSLKTSVLSLRPNIHLQWAKVIYVFLASRGEKSCWLTDVDLTFFKRMFGDLEPHESHAYESSWKPGVACSSEKRLTKISFDHDEHFFLLLLKDYYYVEKFSPVDINVVKELKKIKKEKKSVSILKNNFVEIVQDKKPFIHEMCFEGLKEVKKEEANMKKEEANTKKNETVKTSKEIETTNCEKTIDFKGSLIYEKDFERLKEMKKEECMTKIESKKRLKETKVSNCEKTFGDKCPQPRGLSTSLVESDPTEIPVKLGEKKYDLMSKIFGRVKENGLIKTEKEEFKISFDNTTGLSNVKTSVGSCISLADISPPRIPLIISCNKRPRSISVVTSERRTRKKK